MRRHHPERFLGGENPVSPPGDSDLDRPDTGDSDLPGLCAYDAVVGRPVTYQDAVQREKAIAAELENVKLREDAEIRRGTLLTLEKVEEIQERDDTIILGHLDSFVQFVGSMMPPERITEARSKAAGWLDEIRAKIDADLRAARE